MVSFWVANRAPAFRWMMPVTTQEMKNTGFQAPRQYDVLLTGNISVLGFIIFFNLFACIRRLLCCFFFFFFLLVNPPLGLLCFKWTDLYKLCSSPAVRWANKRRSQARRYRKSVWSLLLFFILSTFCQCAVPSNCMTCPGFSLPFSPPLSPPL